MNIKKIDEEAIIQFNVFKEEFKKPQNKRKRAISDKKTKKILAKTLDFAVPDVKIDEMNELWRKQDELIEKYLDDYQPLISDITHLNGNNSVDIIYNYNPGKAVKKVINSMFYRYDLHGLTDTLSAIRESNRSLFRQLISLPANISIGIGMMLYARMQSKYMCSRIMGVYDILIEQNAYDLKNELLHKGTIMIFPDNIRNLGREKLVDLEDLELYVLLHENIHDKQRSITSDDERSDAINNIVLLKEIKKMGGVKRKGYELLTKYFAHKLLKKYDDSLMAYMCTLEGHATHCSDLLGEEVIDDFDEFSNKLDKSGIWREIRLQLYGMGKKMQQYKKGKKFFKQLDEYGGIDWVNLPLINLPDSMSEIENPERYIDRVEGRYI